MSLQNFFDSFEDSVSIHDRIGVNWSMKGMGCGQIYFYEEDGKICCDNENMSKEFIKHILCKMVDDCKLKG